MKKEIYDRLESLSQEQSHMESKLKALEGYYKQARKELINERNKLEQEEANIVKDCDHKFPDGSSAIFSIACGFNSCKLCKFMYKGAWKISTLTV